MFVLLFSVQAYAKFDKTIYSKNPKIGVSNERRLGCLNGQSYIYTTTSSGSGWDGPRGNCHDGVVYEDLACSTK